MKYMTTLLVKERKQLDKCIEALLEGKTEYRRLFEFKSQPLSQNLKETIENLTIVQKIMEDCNL